MIKIGSISNNYGKSYDGVGAFANIQNTHFPKWVESTIYTADCGYEASKLKRFLGLGMTKAIFHACRDYDSKNFDAVIIEYPFVEWNPLILLPAWILKKKIKKNRNKFVISLHEYQRVNKLRKAVIKCLCCMADLVFVANQDMKQSITGFTSNVVIRAIPTNIYDQITIQELITRNKNYYAYFGLVNKTKAFDEMLQAWDAFNQDGHKTLFIITSSKLDQLEEKHSGIIYLYNKNEKAILKTMRSCMYCIIPVRPEIDMKNTTFKTGSMAGCICLGHFCEEYSSLPFVLNMRDYSIDEFLRVLKFSSNLTDMELVSKIRDAQTFGKQYTPEKISEFVARELKTLVEGEWL